jgi:hypothetical protein
MGVNGGFLAKTLGSIADVDLIKLSVDVINCPQSAKMGFKILIFIFILIVLRYMRLEQRL